MLTLSWRTHFLTRTLPPEHGDEPSRAGLQRERVLQIREREISSRPNADAADFAGRVTEQHA